MSYQGRYNSGSQAPKRGRGSGTWKIVVLTVVITVIATLLLEIGGAWLFLNAPDDYYLYGQGFSLDGVEVGFTLHYSSVMETLTWRIDTPENVQWLITGESPEVDNAKADTP